MLDPDRAVALIWDGNTEPPTLIRVLLDGQDNCTILTFQVAGLCSEQDCAAIAGLLERTWGHALDNLAFRLVDELWALGTPVEFYVQEGAGHVAPDEADTRTYYAWLERVVSG
jgi:hypothetical protein